MLGLALRYLTRRCSAPYSAREYEPGDYPHIRCVRRIGHAGPHRSPFGMEW